MRQPPRPAEIKPETKAPDNEFDTYFAKPKADSVQS